MRPVVCLLTSALFSASCLAQAVKPSFLEQLKAQYGPNSALHNSVTWTGTATWTAGSTHETGPAKLAARTDGSFRCVTLSGYRQTGR